jgi:phosphatidylglycerophosphate synthase
VAAMFARYRQAFGEVRRSYTPEKARDEAHNDFIAFLLYRPLSFVLTPFFLRAGWSADAVTALGGLCSAGMLVAAFAAGRHGCAMVIAIGLLIQVLDCVDGNVARVTRRSSPVGGFLDGLCTMLFWTLYFCSVGVLAAANGSGWVGRHGREIGFVLAALMFAQRSTEDAFTEISRERVRWEPPLPAALPRFDLKRWAKTAEQLLAFGGLFIAGVLHAIPVFLAGLALYQLTVLALWLPRFAGAVHRRSRGDRSPG